MATPFGKRRLSLASKWVDALPALCRDFRRVARNGDRPLHPSSRRGGCVCLGGALLRSARRRIPDSRCISFEWRLNSWRVPPRAAGRALVNGAASRLHPSGFDRSRIHALLRSRECLGAPPLGARQEQNPDFRGINGPPTARERAAGSPIYSTFGILFLTLAHPAFATWQRCSSSCTS